VSRPCLTPQKRLAILKSVFEEGQKVSVVCRKVGISRFTFYNWAKKYHSTTTTRKVSVLSDAHLKGEDHPRFVSSKSTKLILDLVLRHPLWSSHKISDFLKKYNQEKKTTIILTSHYMEDIEKLCKRIIIINQEIFYDGLLSDLIEKYAKNKILQITFNDPVEEKDIKKFGLDYKFNPIEVSFKLPREEVKEKAREILSSNLPVDDIMIDEVEAQSIIRNIFQKVDKR